MSDLSFSALGLGEASFSTFPKHLASWTCQEWTSRGREAENCIIREAAIDYLSRMTVCDSNSEANLCQCL